MRVDVLVLDEPQRARLAGTRFAQVVQLAETTSTNTVLAGEAGRGALEGLVVVADYQSAGRGRFDRRWEAPPGKSLLFSVLARPPTRELPLERRHLAVAAVSLALCEGARAAAGAELALKWPNDLVVPAAPASAAIAGAKVAGVLAEAVPPDGLVIGAGLNVGWAPEGATCLDALAGRPVDRGEVLVEALLALERLYGAWDEVARRYRESCSTVGARVTVSFSGGAPDVAGTAVGIDPDGRLVLRVGPAGAVPGSLLVVAAGDVAHAAVGPAGT